MKFAFRNSDDTGTIFRDVVFLLMLVFAVSFLVAMVHMNPKKKQDQTAQIQSPGNIMVSIYWPPDINVDVDLWVMGPGDSKPVGYSHRAGKTFNLLRDDLGTVNDNTGLNFEDAYSRGTPPGEYIVNVHMYDNKEKPPIWPINVKVIVTESGTTPAKGESKDIWSGTVTLTKPNQEITAVRFTLDKKGNVVPGSINHVQKYLRNASQHEGDGNWNS